MNYFGRRKTTVSKNKKLVVSIASYHYVHVLNLKTNVTKMILGPQCYVCMQDEKVVFGPEKMISVPPTKYCVIENPVVKDEEAKVVVDEFGQTKIRLGDNEIRFAQDPFPLYPGEVLSQKVQDLPIIHANNALHLMALTKFVDDDGNERTAGDEWYFEGPGTYMPRKEVKIMTEISAKVIEYQKALVLKAKRDCVDRNGHHRVCGERWLVKTPGAYLPGVYEEVVEEREAHIFHDSVRRRNVFHLKALGDFTDDYNKQRRMGEEWFLTRNDARSHICNVHEELIDVVTLHQLDFDRYCVIENPVDDDGIPQLGKQSIVRGPTDFFLKPGEEREWGFPYSKIVRMHGSLVLQAKEWFEDEVVHFDDDGTEQKHKVMRKPGDRWMLHGPRSYCPQIEVKIICHQKMIPLDQNGGIYVQNTQTGHVRAVVGESYMLNEYEKLWKKKIPKEVIKILERVRKPLNLTHVVTYQVPHNTAIQIYDYEEDKSRVKFGPHFVMLGPHEQFTLLSLSDGKSKKPDAIKSLCLPLGPDFCTDVIVVQTADHARLSLQLSYNWHFVVPNPCSPQDAAKLFSVPDYVGYMCKGIASRIRGTVASIQFDDFHKHSSRIIQLAVFGLDEQGKVHDQFMFPHNNLCITNIDVLSVEPVDQRARDLLQKSVQLAIEITTNSQEAAARQEAERADQEAQSRLERRKIENETSAERARQTLLKIKVQSAVLESYGQATIEAKIRAEVAQIEAQAAIKQSKLQAEAMVIEKNAELSHSKKARAAELKYISIKDNLVSKYKSAKAKIEFQRFSAMVGAIGPDTLRAMTTASSEHSIRMLSALGLHSTLITDGTTPINLSNTAHSLIGTSMNMNLIERTHSTQDD